jgi:NAD+ kinase
MSDALPRTAVFAGSFDPPGIHHRRTAEVLAQRFDEVIILPAGTRPGRTDADSLPIHRAVMADLNFRCLDRVRVELGDLEARTFTQHHQFAERFGGPDRSVSHVIPFEIARHGGEQRSRIHLEWEEGARVWATEHFTILHEPREPIDPEDLPPRHTLVEIGMYSPSALIRQVLFDHDSADGLLEPEVGRYIQRHGLFRPTPPARDTLFRIPDRKIWVFHDTYNPEAVRLANDLKRYESPDPDIIVVIGGDGTMLRAIRKHWRARRPFYGINTGHLGFLLNDRDGVRSWDVDLRLYQLPLLWVEAERPDGSTLGELAFNDCWLERQTGQTAWVEVAVNGVVRMPKVVADGMLVSTAAGSTSYARAMRATPLPFNAPLLTLAGSNVLKPEYWHPAVLPINSTVRMRNLDTVRRPMQGFIDGVDQGRVIRMSVRVSNIAAVELLFAPEHDPVSKLAVLQFPQPA